MMHRHRIGLGWVAVLLALVACGGEAPPGFDLMAAFPTAPALAGWEPESDVTTYDTDSLYDLVDGQADAFFAYNFSAVAVRDYRHCSGVLTRVEIWELATPDDAYGLFTSGVAGEPLALGNAGDTDPGRRLAFWQERFRVQVRAREPVPDVDLISLGNAIAAALPGGGSDPDLVTRLPGEGLVPRTQAFFRLEISIQDQIWLGGENALGLSPETEGALARYEIGGASGYLMLVRYPEVESAGAGLTGLLAVEAADLVTADTAGRFLAAVFGDLDSESAQALVTEALARAPAD